MSVHWLGYAGTRLVTVAYLPQITRPRGAHAGERVPELCQSPRWTVDARGAPAPRLERPPGRSRGASRDVGRADERRGAHEDDAHLVGLDLLRAWEPVRGARHPRRRLDSLEEEPFLPAVAGDAIEQGGPDRFHTRGILCRRRLRRLRGRDPRDPQGGCAGGQRADQSPRRSRQRYLLDSPIRRQSGSRVQGRAPMRATGPVGARREAVRRPSRRALRRSRGSITSSKAIEFATDHGPPPCSASI